MVSLQGSLLGTQAGPGGWSSLHCQQQQSPEKSNLGQTQGRHKGLHRAWALGRSELGLGATWLLLCSPLSHLGDVDRVSSRDLLHCLEEAWG